MKLLSVAQVREADAFTIAHEPVASVDLMERAARACTDWLLKNYGKENHFVVFCGNGNNGGDGLAIARQLAGEECAADVFIVRVAENDSPDFSANLKRLPSRVLQSEISEAGEIEFPPKPFVIVDALFGSGLSREPGGLAAQMIDVINATKTQVVSIDIPSGLFGDSNLENSYRHVVRATHTISFQQLKFAFLFAENAPYTGRVHVAGIGLHPEYFAQASTPFHLVTHADAKLLFRPREKFAHKGTFGHALIAAGSKGKMGAAVLAAQACLRSGAGLVTAFVPQSGNDILQVSVPEAMTTTGEAEHVLAGRIPGNHSAVGIGPGIGTADETVRAMKLLLHEYAGPFVIDADALNILAENKTWLAFLPKGTILTPHPGEFDRLTEKHKTGEERLKSQRALATRHGIYIVLKGAYTTTACPDGSVLFNSSGNPGMATGGSGDVLTGVITALRAQGYNPQAACVLGVYVHGLAGDIAASVHGQEGMKAGDIVENLGGTWRMVSGS